FGLVSILVNIIISVNFLVFNISRLKLDSKPGISEVILACYSIGLGAFLTPIGEPLLTIATNKLDEEFFYLFKLFSIEIIIFVLIVGVISYFILKPNQNERDTSEENAGEKIGRAS